MLNRRTAPVKGQRICQRICRGAGASQCRPSL